MIKEKLCVLMIVMQTIVVMEFIFQKRCKYANFSCFNCAYANFTQLFIS
uniref:Uncharacterized protein n=1 Tax=Ascaris lumbricoides TaxID=6252 RepID=A0A0M3ISH0_ASCLU